ncbi:MAG: pseudaminic acid synthase [Desulfobacula sp.]|nr:pseudaminic acid synthase [Desulfobacula sp.]
MSFITIREKKIGKDHPPFIIAEMSGNHNQSLDRALKIVEAAANAGAHALKLQTYTADTMTLDLCDDDFCISDKGGLWDGESLYNLYQKAHTPWKWHKPIFDRCKELGLICFSTPFDETAVDFLESLNVPCYKIASFENIDIQLIKKVASTGKPVIISTGMATIAELAETIQKLRDTGCDDFILLKCTSSYPSTPKNSNLNTIPHMQDLFNCQVGLSDHTLGNGVSIASIALGATVIEKHFTLSREDGGVDSAFSIDPNELKNLVNETKRAWQSLGDIHYGPTDSEKKSFKFRRSLYVVKDIQKGESLSKENLKAIRPGYGLPPKYYQELTGKKVNQNLKKGTPFRWSFIG